MKQIYHESKQINREQVIVTAYAPDLETEHGLPGLIHVVEQNWDITSSPDPYAPATDAPAAKEATATLNVFVHENHPFDLVKPLFEAKYPNVKLNMMKNNDMNVLRTALAAGDTDPGGVPDIFWPEPFDVQQLGKTGVLFDCTALIEKHKSEFPEGKLAECYIPATGKYASVPGAISPTGLFWRPDI